MTHDDKLFDQAVSAMRKDEPDTAALDAAESRLYSRMSTEAAQAPETIQGCEGIRSLIPSYRSGRLSAARKLLVQDHLKECAACRTVAHAGTVPSTAWIPPAPRLTWSFAQVAVAAALIAVIGCSVFFAANWYFATPAGARATVQSMDGAVYRVSPSGQAVLRAGDALAEGDVVRTSAGAHAFVQLRDGSVVEMNERSEFAVTARRNDTTVHLDQGRVIVQAAKRRSGHLYVLTPDCRVAVTGTVFSVNSGLKGSRVAVIEGAVQVAFASTNQVLHPGEETETSQSMSRVAVRDEISWSRNLDKHLELLAQFAQLQKKFADIETPGLRYSSAIFPLLPANIVIYGSIPNLGDALNDANRIFQDQLQQSAVLRAWWEKRQKNSRDGVSFDDMVSRIHSISRYIGDEVVFAVLPGTAKNEMEAVAIAQARTGLRDELQAQFASLTANDAHGSRFVVIDQQQLASMPEARNEVIALVRPDFVLFSGSVRTLQIFNAQLGQGGFAATDFGARIQQVYAHGAGMMFAFNLQQMMAESAQRNAARQQHHDEGMRASGFSDARYLIAEHRDLSGTPDNRIDIAFAGPRRGIVSWLAAPAPIGSLEYVSPNAGLVFAFVAKSPALMLEDMVQMAGSASHNSADLDEADKELGISVRNDLAAAFGGDVTFALDGPILPKPSWKFIVEVNDSERAQNAFSRLIEAVNREANKHGRAGVEMTSEDIQGRRYYSVRPLDNQLSAFGETHYTFADGYMVAASSQALVANALKTRSGNDSLVRSAEFRALLPRGPNADVSGVLYQNLAPLVQPIAGQLSAQQLQALQQITADTKPTVICAYGSESGIELASASRLLPFDINRMGIAALLGAQRKGTSHTPEP